MTADDLTSALRGYAPGWDLTSGWGRVNAYEAVRAVRRKAIPPVPDIDSPRWYAPASGRVRVRGSIDGRSATSWKLMLGRGEQPSSWTEIATGDSTGGRSPPLAVVNAAALAPDGYTLLLRATDANGNVGEDRAFFYALDAGQRLHRGFPRFLGTSGEASPQLADLNRDGDEDIILATSDGLVRAYSGRRGQMLDGWPKRMRRTPGAGATARRIGAVRSGFVGTPAVGNIARGGGAEVVAAGLDGRLYAWTRRGKRVRGFPFRIDLRRPAEDGRLDAAIYSSPALADLRGNRRLEIVFGAADQRIYALKGNGRPVRGWPVLARDGGDAAKILSSPAIGDLDGNGSIEVIEGTAEAYGSTPSTSGRVHAFTAGGDPVPGWPVKPPALAADSIPLAGEGVPVSPSLADVDGDGDDEVAVASFTGQPELYDGDGSRLGGAGGLGRFQTLGRGLGSPATAPATIGLGANGAFGRLADGGPLRFFGGVVDLRLAQAQLQPATKVHFEHLLGGWDASSGTWLNAFPIPVEGWEILTAPALADVGGGAGAEVINGTSGNLLHAFGATGSEPEGWPKEAGGWLLASPAVGDVDRDPQAEVVAVTRDGYLFVWNTPAAASGPQWASFRHDRRNTGNYGGG
jgi:hypothetical protein